MLSGSTWVDVYVQLRELRGALRSAAWCAAWCGVVCCAMLRGALRVLHDAAW